MRQVLLASVVVALLAAPAPAGATPVHGVYSEEQFAGTGSARDHGSWLQRAAGFSSIRLPLYWRDVERVKGQLDWFRYDLAFASAAAHGLTVLPFVQAAPAWASGASPGDHRIHPPRDPLDYAAFVAACVARYGTGGSFWAEHPELVPRPPTAWQVWNEPNLSIHWQPAPDAPAYARMLRVTAPVIRSVDPSAAVLLAGLPDSRLGVPLNTFLADLYAAGIKGDFDALAINAYAPDAAGVLAIVDGARRVAHGRGDTGIPTWVTEFGYASGGDPSHVTTDEPGQARLASETTLALRGVAADWDLRGLFYFNWRDPVRPAGRPDVWPYHAGLLRRDGSAKPALQAVAAAFAAPLKPIGRSGGARPRLRMTVRLLSSRRSTVRRGPRVRIRCSRTCKASFALLARSGGASHTSGRWTRTVRAGRATVARLRLRGSQRRWLVRHERARLRLAVTALTPDGALARAERAVPRGEARGRSRRAARRP